MCRLPSLFSVLSLCFLAPAGAFAPTGPLRPFPGRTARLVPRALPSDDSDAAGSSMTEPERMAAVRRLQRAFYRSDGGPPAARLDLKSGAVLDLPLWRVGWTELPGRTNCLNVREGRYTHMFETILAGPAPHYVGHLYRPGGGEKGTLRDWRAETEDPDRFTGGRSAVLGCLLRVTDHRRLEDGRLVVLVHALERFVVERAVREEPYAIADVRILPDAEDVFRTGDHVDENFAAVARARAVAASFRYHGYECDPAPALPLSCEAAYLPAAGVPADDLARLLPFAAFAGPDRCPPEPPASAPPPPSPSAFSGGEPALERRLRNGGVLRVPPTVPGPEAADRRSTDAAVLETLLWLALDEFCGNTGFVPPPELTCLVPPALALNLDVEALGLSPRYPAARRRRRLSYAAPGLLEKVDKVAADRHLWLAAPGTRERLAAVLEMYERVNASLR